MFNEEYFELYKQLEKLTKADPSLPIYNSPKEPELPDYIEKDSQFGHLGNRFSYKKFISFNPDAGIHISIDGNSIGALSSRHGHLMGNEAIRFIFESISDLAKTHRLHAFRTSGDKAKVIAKTPEQGVQFVKELEQIIDSSPVLAGTEHKVTVAVGIGYTPIQSEEALAEAKDILGDMVNSSRVKKFQLGKEPYVYVSKLHNAPPDSWKPLNATKNFSEAIVPRGLKLQHPLK
jgi:hypothetical protein